MRSFCGEKTLMRVFIGEADRCNGKPLYQALVELFRERGLAGATVLKGVMGFGASSLIHTDSILSLSADLPVVIELVDTRENIDKVLPELDDMLHGGMITLEKAHVIHYSRKKS